MKKGSIYAILACAGILVVSLFYTTLGADWLPLESVLHDVWDSTNHTLQIEVTQQEITGQLTSESLIVNGSGADADSYFEGDTDTTLLYIDAGNDRVAISTSTPDTLLHVEETTALTATVDYPLRLTHDTSGTPADNIGLGVQFEQETSAANNEVVMSLATVVTDATATSEDAKFQVSLMAAGAAAAQKFAVESSGVLTLVNDETIDNTTDGRIDLNGDVYIAGAVKLEACTIAADDATPDVAGCAVLTTSANTGATAITDLDNPVVGSIVCILGGSDTNSSTIADSGNFALSGAFTASLDDVLCLYVQADNDYIELSVTDN
jgi:hypothetical protein